MLDPLIYGDYPAEMRQCHGLALPKFSANEKRLLRGSIDFIGVNHYSTLYVKDCINSTCPSGGDRPIRGFLNTTSYRDGVPIGEPVYYLISILKNLLLSPKFKCSRVTYTLGLRFICGWKIGNEKLLPFPCL